MFLVIISLGLGREVSLNFPEEMVVVVVTFGVQDIEIGMADLARLSFLLDPS